MKIEDEVLLRKLEGLHSHFLLRPNMKLNAELIEEAMDRIKKATDFEERRATRDSIENISRIGSI